MVTFETQLLRLLLPPPRPNADRESDFHRVLISRDAKNEIHAKTSLVSYSVVENTRRGAFTATRLANSRKGVHGGMQTTAGEPRVKEGEGMHRNGTWETSGAERQVVLVYFRNARVLRRNFGVQFAGGAIRCFISIISGGRISQTVMAIVVLVEDIHSSCTTSIRSICVRDKDAVYNMSSFFYFMKLGVIQGLSCSACLPGMVLKRCSKAGLPTESNEPGCEAACECESGW